jgi:hypothetical protein
MKRGKVPKESRRRKPKVVSGGPVRLASTKRLHANSPPDSASHSSSNNLGILRSAAERSPEPLPEPLKDAGDVKSSALLPGRIMLTITVLALIFIAIITWFVSRMPAK